MSPAVMQTKKDEQIRSRHKYSHNQLRLVVLAPTTRSSLVAANN